MVVSRLEWVVSRIVNAHAASSEPNPIDSASGGATCNASAGLGSGWDMCGASLLIDSKDDHIRAAAAGTPPALSTREGRSWLHALLRPRLSGYRPHRWCVGDLRCG